MPPTKRAQPSRSPAPTQRSAEPDVPTGRQVAREQMVRRIRVAAHAQLVTDGAAGLSMRAVARDVGVVSSAIYRYVPSRDALLHLLITDSLDSLGAAVTAAEAAVRRSDLRGRFAAVARANRAWALASPAEHSLVASRPVPGFEAEAAGAPALGAVPTLLLHVVDEASAKAGNRAAQDGAPRLPAGIRRDLGAVRRTSGVTVGEDGVARALLAWSGITGAISLEMSGQLAGLSTDADAWFAHEVDRLARLAGVS